MPDTVGDLFQAGRLDDAIEAANGLVRKEARATAARVLLAELVLFAGELARADQVLETAATLDPEAALVVAEFRQLVRAETVRRQVVLEGRPPEFLDGPTPAQGRLLEALAALRAGDRVRAAVAAKAAEAARPAVAGTLNGVRFDDFRDADDLCAGLFEVLTTTGKYYWIPTERVAAATFHAIRRPRDLFWRRCSMTVRDGPAGDVYLPALYLDPGPADERLRLGRETSWSDGIPVRGRGQRVFVVGEAGVPILDLGSVEFA